jgi:hypothetical protein
VRTLVQSPKPLKKFNNTTKVSYNNCEPLFLKKKSFPNPLEEIER